MSTKDKTPLYIFWGITLLIQSTLILIEAFVWTEAMNLEISWLGFNKNTTFGWAMFLLQFAFTIYGYRRRIGPTELGARLLFGLPINNLSSGLVWIPPFMCQLVIAPKNVIQNELPSDPEHIYRGKDEVPSKKFPPIRIPFVGSSSKKDDPYDEKMTQEVVPVIRWRITDFCLFLSMIGSVEDAVEQMEDRTVSVLLEMFSKITPAQALARMDYYNDELKKAIEDRVSLWGIVLDSAKIKAINFSSGFNSSVQEIAEETAKKKALIKKSEGVNNQKILEGAGDAEAAKLILIKRGIGLTEMAKNLGVDPNSILGSETARNIAGGEGQTTFVAGSGGYADIINAAAVAGSAFKPLDKSPKKGRSDDER